MQHRIEPCNTQMRISFLSPFLMVLGLLLIWPSFGRTDQSELTLITEFGGAGSAVGQFDTPRGVAIDNQGQIIIADTFNNRIQICSRSGSCTAFGTKGSQAGQFFTPTDVAVDSEDRIIVVDSDNDRMQVCDHQGNCTPFGGLGRQLGRFDAPIAVAVDGEDRIVIGDQFNGRVQICDDQGTCNSIGRLVKDPMNFQPGEFGFVMGVAVDQQDRILVTESIGGGGDVRKTLQSCSPDCSVIKTFENPSYIAVDHFNRIFVVGNGEVHRCDHAGHCDVLQMAGDSLWRKGLAFTQANELVVSYERDHRIRIFANPPPFKINPGLNDAWFNPATDGQGFFITVFPDLGVVSLAWFTYDTELPPIDAVANLGDAGHRWLTAIGPISDNQVMMNITMTSGGIFDTSTEIERTDPAGSDGTITLTFDSCNSGTVEYDIPSINREGIVPIQRVANDNIVLCEALIAD